MSMHKNKPIKAGKRDQVAEVSVYGMLFFLSSQINEST